MRLARALELTHNIASTPNAIEGLDSLLDPSLVEQNANQALKIADRAYVLENGRVVMQGTGEALLTDPKVLEAYLGG